MTAVPIADPKRAVVHDKPEALLIENWHLKLLASPDIEDLTELLCKECTHGNHKCNILKNTNIVRHQVHMQGNKSAIEGSLVEGFP